MSKSLKNFVTVRELLNGDDAVDPEAFRIFCGLHRYASTVSYSRVKLAEADAALRPMRAGRAVGPVVALAARGDCATCTDLGRATIRCNLAKADATRTCDHAFCYLCFRKSLDREDMRCPVCKIGFAAISNTGPRKTFEVIFHPVEAPEPKTLASKKSRGRSRCGYCKLHDIVSFEHNVSTCPLAPETEPQEKRRLLHPGLKIRYWGGFLTQRRLL